MVVHEQGFRLLYPWLKFLEVDAQGCFVKSCLEKFCNIFRKAPTMETFHYKFASKGLQRYHKRKRIPSQVFLVKIAKKFKSSYSREYL